MGIKTATKRSTYRSNVKSRPLQWNGIEAQYQGLEINEINIDHAGLYILCRGGVHNRQNYVKSRKKYIVQNDETDGFVAYTTITFGYPDTGAHNLTNAFGAGSPGYTGIKITLQDHSGSNSKTYIFATSGTTGALNGSSEVIVNINSHVNSLTGIMDELKTAIEGGGSGNGHGIASFNCERTDYKLKISMTTAANTNGALSYTNNTVNHFTPGAPTFVISTASNFWALEGRQTIQQDHTKFYEDMRTDHIQSATMHSFVWEPGLSAGDYDKWLEYKPVKPIGDYFNRHQQLSDGTIDTAGNIIINYDSRITTLKPPTSETVNTTIMSDEERIQSYPLREVIYNQYRDNHTYVEDPHWITHKQQTWTQMENHAYIHGQTLEQAITVVLNHIYTPLPYFDLNPMSERIDVFHRVERALELHSTLYYDRHRMSVFDQYLDPLIDFINIRESQFPKQDCNNRDLAFQDVQGKRDDGYWYQDDGAGGRTLVTVNLVASVDWDITDKNPVLFDDYFDQQPLGNHDHIEDERYTRIDSDMLAVLTNYSGRTTILDRREYQESDYVITATGFISSQNTTQGGIVYREMLR